MKFILFSLLSFSIFSCEEYKVESIGYLKERLLEETSGIAASRQYKGTIWAHNDSGDGPRFFAFSKTGEPRGQFEIAGATHHDWEDMAIAKCPGPKGSGDCLYFGDIGDNPFERKDLRVFVVKEPRPALDNSVQTIKLLKQYKVKLDTKARNFETMLIDGDKLVLISKSDARSGKKYKEEGISHIYLSTLGEEEKIEAKKVASYNFLDLPGFKKKNKGKSEKWQNYFSWLTAGDYNDKKQKLVLLTYGLLFEFDASDWKNIKLVGKPYVLPKMPQAESVTYLNDGSIMVVSEYSHQPIYEFKCQ